MLPPAREGNFENPPLKEDLFARNRNFPSFAVAVAGAVAGVDAGAVAGVDAGAVAGAVAVAGAG